MKIGIIADTHDHLPRTRAALERFRVAGVTHVLHAGDVCSPFVFLLFKEFKIPFTAVFGNNDGEWLFLIKVAHGLGEIKKGPLALELGPRKIALMHEPVFLDALADSGHFDLIVSGHTHDLDERRRADALIVNPGECCGYLRNRATAMICDLDTMAVTVAELA
ncbi:MAG TPA: metallophosphoesterase [bacterium]|nr:metallophosphoesterase [bacterium]